MLEALPAIIIAILTPFLAFLQKHKTTATDVPPPPNRERWAERVRKFKSSLRS